MADKLIVEMILDPKLDSSGKKKVEKESGQVGKKSGSKFENEFKKETKNLGSGLKASLAGLGTAIAAVGVGRLISQSIDLAKRQEDAINSLNVALQITGKFSQAASQQIQDLASDIQKSTRFGDEELLETAALIQQLGDLTVKDLGEATRATADFAAALRIDLRSAATLVGKAAAGEIGSFSRYGVVIEKGKNNAETFSNTLTKLNSKFGGAAAGQVNTFSGAVDQLGNTFGDTLEELGFFITQNETLIEGLKGGLGFLNDFAGGLKGIRIGLFGIGNASTELGKVDQEIAKIADKISEISKNKSELNPDSASYFFGGSFEKDTARLDGWIAAREVKLKALLERRKEILKTSEGEDTGGGADDDNSNLLSKTQLLAQVKLQNDERIKESALLREQALTELNQRGLISDQEFATSFIAIETEKTNLLAELDRKKEQSAINASENISGAFVAAAKNSKQTASQIGATLNTLATRGFGNAFRTIGAALANGENINKAFIGSVKNTVSEVASAFGDYYIKLGVATLASPNPAGGAAMIAGGAGLKLLSGALGASGGGGGGGGASAVSGQVGFGSDFSDTGAIEQQDVERRDPNTNVEIVVQGSLVQQEELGLFITETLNESFGKQGVSLNDARFA
jgi:F0F1-type ATP synthase membrane subunit c/vacuolar-type H+-ATPase subunit K